ncbi:hypothetical protein [Saccharopolyspora sp. ASAGF58]|uniref:hypothetical protein n=1 Tax=Saccharopolyspora sp. ASAGF58 TaxID=2719023 RepID=UPI00144003E6|nr:hypothetical protein [Saccharopolyspora sp. ASAGF58]QIZ37033.1 hypothetical protein FDZ84_23270 [Saccharopolyspora sp. ASAGF58]
MTRIADLLQQLQMVKDMLPRQAGEPYRNGFELVGQQVAAALRTSTDESAVLGAIEQAKQDGIDTLGAHLDEIDRVIDTAPSTW